MRIFVAGATGVLGWRTVSRLLAAGHDITGLARNPGRAALLDDLGARPATVSLFDSDALRAAVAGHQAVINLATAIPSGSRAGHRSAWEENHRIRRHGAHNLVEAARAADASTFIQESITLLYTDSGDNLIDESAPVEPTWTTASALDAEAAAASFTGSARNAVVLRFGLLYGPDSAHTLDTVAAVRAGVASEPGPPSAYRSSITTDDAAAAVVAALHAPSGTYNVVDSMPLRQREYLDAVATALDFPPLTFPPDPVRLPADFEMLSRSHRVSNGRFMAATSWRPQTPSAWQGWQAIAAQLASATGTAS